MLEIAIFSTSGHLLHTDSHAGEQKFRANIYFSRVLDLFMLADYNLIFPHVVIMKIVTVQQISSDKSASRKFGMCPKFPAAGSQQKAMVTNLKNLNFIID